MNNFKFTVISKKTNERFTYRVKAWTDNNYKQKKSYTVAVLTGSDNNTSYETIGYIHKEDNLPMRFFHAKRKRISTEAPSYKAFAWMFVNMRHEQKLSANVIIYNSGKCAKCGRTLTDPLSIERGLGPECFTFLKFNL